MKKIALSIFMILVFILSACTKQDDVKQTTQIPTKEPVKATAFEKLGINAPGNGIVLLANNPGKDKAALVNISESIKLDTTDEHIYIIPRDKNTDIQIWSLRESNGEIVRNELVYEKRRTSNDFVLDANVIRPEGMPRYKMVVYTPDSYAEYFFSYNGKDGNPELEYIPVASLKSSDKFSFHEMGYMFTNVESDIISVYGDPAVKKSEPLQIFEGVTSTELNYGSSVFKTFDLGGKSGQLYNAIVADNKIIHPRGIKIGDDMQSVIDKFPNTGSKTKIKFEDNPDRTYSLLYGKYFHMQDYGIIEYVGDVPVCITYSTESSNLVFELENGKVSKVRYEIPLT